MKKIDELQIGDTAYIYTPDWATASGIVEDREHLNSRFIDLKISGCWYRHLNSDNDCSLNSDGTDIVCTTRKSLNELLDCEIEDKNKELHKLEMLKALWK